MPKSNVVLDAHGLNLDAALKANKKLAKLYSQQTEAIDGAADKAKAKFKVKIDKLIAGLPAEVAELVKANEPS